MLISPPKAVDRPVRRPIATSRTVADRAGSGIGHRPGRTQIHEGNHRDGASRRRDREEQEMAVTRRVLFGMALSAAAFTAGWTTMPATAAAEYPERPITLIVPVPAGGGTHTHKRVLGHLVRTEEHTTEDRPPCA